MKQDRPKLIFRKTRQNRHTLPRLLGILEGEGLDADFDVGFGESPGETARLAHAGEGIIAFSFMTPHLAEVKREVEALRSGSGKHCLIIAGGSHASGDPRGTLNLGFDHVFSGEADQIFPGFLRGYLRGDRPASPILSGRGKSCPLGVHPPFSLSRRFFAPVELSRGCLYNCLFCQTPRIFDRPLRHRRVDDLSGFLRKAVPLGYRQFTFISSNAFAYGTDREPEPDLAALEELLAGCAEMGAAGVHFGCYPSEVRPDWVNSEILNLVKKYCRNRTIVLGAQSGSDSILGALHRGHTAGQSLEAARLIFSAGFTPHVDFVFGFPEETANDRRLSLAMIRRMIDRCGARIHVHSFMPLPGTPLFEKEPTRLDDETRNALGEWGKKGKLDGWWQDQEKTGWQIVKWREEGMIKA
jgi:B12-binding domain/radical SAM domain protein